MVFKPGRSGNPLGRPRGAKNKLSELAYSALAEDFEEHGIDAIRRVRTQEPAAYLRFVASVLPKEFELAVATQASHIDQHADLLIGILAAVKQAVPGDDTAQQLQFAVDAIKLCSARVIENTPLQHVSDNAENSRVKST